MLEKIIENLKIRFSDHVNVIYQALAALIPTKENMTVLPSTNDISWLSDIASLLPFIMHYKVFFNKVETNNNIYLAYTLKNEVDTFKNVIKGKLTARPPAKPPTTYAERHGNMRIDLKIK